LHIFCEYFVVVIKLLFILSRKEKLIFYLIIYLNEQLKV